MPSSEDYTIVWAGVYQLLKENDVRQVARGTHPLMKLAREVGLECWYDSFEADPEQGSRPCLLIGSHLKTLGYKEGATKCELSAKRIGKTLATTKYKFRRMKLKNSPKIYVLVHIEDVD